jgi:hypothetical protein
MNGDSCLGMPREIMRKLRSFVEHFSMKLVQQITEVLELKWNLRRSRGHFRLVSGDLFIYDMAVEMNDFDASFSCYSDEVFA